MRRKTNAPAPPDTTPPQPPGESAASPTTVIARPARQPQAGASAEPARGPAQGWTYWRDRLRWAFGLAALGAALLAQNLTTNARDAQAGSPPLLSWILYGVAIALFMLAVPRSPYLAPQATTPFKSTLRAMRRRRLVIGLFAGAALCGLASVPLFAILNQVGRVDTAPADPGPLVNYGSWALYVAALLLLAAAWIVWERTAPASESKKPLLARPWPAIGGQLPRNVEWVIMGALLLLGLLLRLPNLDSAPPGLWFDEAMNGMVGRDLLLPDSVNAAYVSQETQMGALYFYFLGLVTQIFGQADVWPLRLLPALAGSLIAPLLYIVGSRLFGWRVGLAAGVFVAVSVWNITMSRIGMVSIPTVALNVAVYACLVQALRTGRLGYYAAAGVLLGLALQMYYPSQLVPLVLALVFGHLLVTGRMAAFRAVRAGVATFALAAVLAAVPILTFALQYPQVYTERAGTVSIFSPEGSDNNPNALNISLNSHALMFTFQGDRNPRHNLGGAPMLEWPVTALFVVGLGSCVLRLRRWQYFFPMVWLLVGMSGGVLSAVFEAPQGHRTLENSVVTALIAGIFAGELWALFSPKRKQAHEGQGTRTKPSPLTPRPSPLVAVWVGAAVFVGLLAWAGVANYDRYFNRQVVNASVWNEMQGANRVVADVLLRYGDTHRVLVNPTRNSSPATRYLAPDYWADAWSGLEILPFIDNRDTIFLVDSTEEPYLSVIKTFYPGATVESMRFGEGPQGQLYMVTVPGSEMAAVRGVRYATYTDGSVSREGTRATMALDEVAEAPPGSTFEMSTTLKISAPGNYTFGWEPPLNPAPAGAEPLTVLVDGAAVPDGQPVPLGAGLHALVVRGAAESASPGTEMLWEGEQDERGPIPETVLFDPQQIAPMGLTAYVRRGEGFEGPLATMRVDPVVSFYFHNTPVERPYTTEWVGKVFAPIAGTYTFHTEQISRSSVFVDGREVLFNNRDNSLESGQADLTRGLHDIRVQYQDLAGYSHMYLFWTPPGRDGRYVIPARFLLPDMEQYPAVPSTGSWPSAEEADDTVWDLNPASQTPGTQPQPTPNTTPVEVQPTVTVPAEQEPQPTTTAPAAGASPVAPLVLLGGPDDTTLTRPLTGAADEDGNLYIFTEAGKVHRFGPGGEPQGSWDVKDAEGNPLTEVSAMLVRGGQVSLLDAASSMLVTYTLEGEEQGRTQLCQCFYPRGMSAAPDGNLWVADTGLGRVIKVTPQGDLVSTLGEQGTAAGQFMEPAGVWQAPDGTVYVADVGNARVQSFDADGKPIAQWPTGMSTARDGSRVVARPDGNVLVTQQQVQAIVMYDRQGTELARWAYNPGSGSQAPSTIVPTGEDGRYLVLFPFNATALVFSP